MICENKPRYGVIVVEIMETKDTSKIEKVGADRSDMFLEEFIICSKCTNYF